MGRYSFSYLIVLNDNTQLKNRENINSPEPINPYCASQILPILCYVPSVTKVLLLHFYPYTVQCNKSVRHNSASKILQLCMHFQYSKIALNRLNLVSKCRAEFWLPADIQFVGYSWEFSNQNSMQTMCLPAVSVT